MTKETLTIQSNPSEQVVNQISFGIRFKLKIKNTGKRYYLVPLLDTTTHSSFKLLI